MEQLNEKFHLAEQQLRQELARKVHVTVCVYTLYAGAHWLGLYREYKAPSYGLCCMTLWFDLVGE